jgi:signal peptidase II
MLKNQQASALGLWATFTAAFAASLGLDLWTKQWAWDTLRAPGEAVMLWAPTLELSFAYNRGSAFGVVRELDSPMLILAITTLLIGWVVGMTWKQGAGRPGFAGAGMIVGGALGNLYDRLFRVDELGQHGVVDFIRVNFPWGASWPNFNVADAVLVVGVLLLLWSLRRPGGRATP